eukprot:CAMPEP_0169066116 /NCGR_PEP_ID=MMETSP1015-20121227/2779_1 /TAXON_ID=342587 /ORGANISM="Karlodinium micrum, Strain CCMP2283" /LENGTH=266 /DNA_ID=CAMNT_0009124763 /DNA_START=53 /DNA_END=853 /DNA_ORIENTATION=+
MAAGILLDDKIRDYVLIPIFLVVVMISMLRQNLMAMFGSAPKFDPAQAKTNNMLTRCRMLKGCHGFISEKVFSKRKAYFVGKRGCLVGENAPKPKDPMEMMQAGGGDPMAMMGMMKNNMVFMVLQGLLAYWVSHLFSGFVVAKTPFPLGFQFKGMLQRGVDVQALDPGYVSSLCWYMFVMMCSHSIASMFQALFKSDITDAGEDPMMAMMGSMGGAGMMPGGGPDMSKVYKQEQESLEMINHEQDYLLHNIEMELFKKWQAEKRRG